jgi:hypothetical protein
MISASTMPPSLRSTVMDTLAQGLGRAQVASRPRRGWGSWSECALQLAPIRWGPEAPFASLPMRNARVRAMAFPGTARRAILGPTKVNRSVTIRFGSASINHFGVS